MGIDVKKLVEVAGRAAKAVSENDDIKKTILGTYSDGTPRSLVDAYQGEILSPEDRLLIEERMKEIRKKKKKKNKKKKSKWEGLSD